MAETKRRNTRLIDELIPDAAFEHAQSAREEIRKSFEAFLPPGVIEHRRAARREMLLAVRSVIDAALERMDEKKK